MESAFLVSKMSSRHVVAKYEVKGQRFEILVKPDLALRFKEGEKIDIDEILVGDYVYKDIRRGLKASPESLKKAFGTDDIRKVAETILRHGEVQLTTEQRRKIIENKKKQIINLIAKNAVDPKTKLPIPPKRIELAMEQAKIHIDIYKSPESQLESIVSKLARVMPIKIAKAYLAVRIPPQYSGRLFKQLRSLGEVRKTNWLSDGSLLAEIEIPAGLQEELISKINKLTHGSASVKVLYVK